MCSKAIDFVPVPFKWMFDDNVNHINGLMQSDCEVILYDALHDECEITMLQAIKGIEKIFEGRIYGESLHKEQFLEKMIEIYHKNKSIKSYNEITQEIICKSIRVIGLIGRQSKKVIDIIKDAYFSNIEIEGKAIIRKEALDAMFRICFFIISADNINEFDEELINIIDKAILDTDNNVRKSALEFIIKHIDYFVELKKIDYVIDKLINVLKYPNNDIKVMALKCIGRFAKERDDVFKIIKNALFDKNIEIRSAAIEVCVSYCLYERNENEIPKIAINHLNKSFNAYCKKTQDIKYIASIEIYCSMVKNLLNIEDLTSVREKSNFLLKLAKHHSLTLRKEAILCIGEIIRHIINKCE